jgi:hypothetical protein
VCVGDIYGGAIMAGSLEGLKNRGKEPLESFQTGSPELSKPFRNCFILVTRGYLRHLVLLLSSLKNGSCD